MRFDGDRFTEVWQRDGTFALPSSVTTAIARDRTLISGTAAASSAKSGADVELVNKRVRPVIFETVAVREYDITDGL